MLGKTPLEDLENEIDRIDGRILSLLDQRMALALQIEETGRQSGKGVEDVEREGERKGVTALICTTVLESNPEQAGQKMRAAARLGDLVELRLDALEHIKVDDFLPFSESRLIVTNRKREEGGFFKGGEEERISYLKEAVKLGASFVDLEYKTPKDLRQRLMEMKGETQVIISYHETEGTPSLEELLSLFQAMSGTGADLVKIVTTANTLEDSLTLFRFLAEVRDKGRGVVAHCMGEPGRISRVLSPLFGSHIAYVAPFGGREGAPGQMDAHQMRHLWEMLGL